MTADIEKMKALALAATPGPWQWWTSNSTLRLTGADGRDGGVLYAYGHAGAADVSCSEANREFIAACRTAVPELIAEVERLRAVMKQAASGYESGFFASSPRDLDGKFTLHYESPQEAEAAFEALTSAIEAELPSRDRAEGGNTSKCVGCEGSPSGENSPCAVCGGTAPTAGTVEKDAERYRVLRSHVVPRDVSISMTVPVTDIPPNQTIEERIDMLCDIAIAAHTKAAKEPT